jgi:tetratricopeptide (TPR) repeat protein
VSAATVALEEAVALRSDAIAIWAALVHATSTWTEVSPELFQNLDWPRLIEAAAALHENRLDIAERILKPHLKEDPFDVRAIRMLAELAARIGRLKDSETLLRRALEIAPNFSPARAATRCGRGAMAPRPPTLFS